MKLKQSKLDEEGLAPMVEKQISNPIAVIVGNLISFLH